MYVVSFRTRNYRPDQEVTIRTAVDGWSEVHLPGLFEADEWRFTLDERTYPQGTEFKFVLDRSRWMAGGNLKLATGAVFDDSQVAFTPQTEAIVENGSFQDEFFKPNLDENVLYDVIVIGSGIGGGLVADQLSDAGQRVLLLEAGSLLFTTHVGNLPRRQRIGAFDKHVWNLFSRYKVTNYVNDGGAGFIGGQAFNLGGRSIFWGGLIPRMTWWELEAWPESLRWFLEDSGYQLAEDLMYWPSAPTDYQLLLRRRVLPELLPDFHHFDAPVAVRDLMPSSGSIATGLFSTADLLTESRLTEGPSGNANLTVNLNHAVIRLETNGNKVTGVVARDLLARKDRIFRAKRVVLSAGTIESAKIASMSGLKDANGLVGKGLTDHPIYYTHFAIPETSPHHTRDARSKTLSRHKRAGKDAHPYNMVLELGADLNQGRYLDDAILEAHRAAKKNAMICEIVFLFDSPLVDENRLVHAGGPGDKPKITMRHSTSADAFLDEARQIQAKVITSLGGEAIAGENTTLPLNRADLGGACHEAGTLRLGAGNTGVVDEDLKWNGYDNLFVCDLSVFPTSPAANPTLTLSALALRLAQHIATLPPG